jgi:hypothetical protein
VPETSLHTQLKEYLRVPGDVLEAEVWGYRADLIRGDQVIEVQTQNFIAIRSKLRRLVKGYQVTLVYPITQKRTVTRLDGGEERHRTGPRRGRAEGLFDELIYCPELPLEPRFRLLVVFVHDEEVLVNDGAGARRRRRWSIADRKLISVLGTRLFSSPSDYATLLPPLPRDFSTRDLQRASGLRVTLARRMLYTLNKMGQVRESGKVKRAKLYRLTGT